MRGYILTAYTREASFIYGLFATEVEALDYMREYCESPGAMAYDFWTLALWSGDTRLSFDIVEKRHE